MTTTTPTKLLAKTVVSSEAKLPKNYAGFNTATIEGIIYHAELATNNGDEFVVVQIIQNLQNDDVGCVFQFTTASGVLKLFRDGFLTVGRRVHLTGHMKEITSVYTNEKTGETMLRKRPLVKMDKTTLTLAPMPSKKDA